MRMRRITSFFKSKSRMASESPPVWSGWRKARDSLREWRSGGEGRSEYVLSFGTQLLNDYSSSLGAEVWDVHEQVCVASMELGRLEPVRKSLSSLEQQFPGSLRVQRLRGMLLEAQGRYEDALKLYEEVLSEQPTCAVLWKRKVAVYKAMGERAKAIAELNKLLKVFMSDQEAWTELADLYLEHNEYDKAAFCLEELVMANPHHHLFHQRYAEVCYSQKSVESLEVSRKHFAMATKLNPDNMRALYGFYMASLSLSHHPKVKSRDTRAQNSRYTEWVRAQIRHKYMQFDTEKLTVVEKMLEKT